MSFAEPSSIVYEGHAGTGSDKYSSSTFILPSPRTTPTMSYSLPTQAYSDHSAYPSSSAYSFTPQPNFGYDSLSDLPAFHDYDYPTYDHVHEPIQYAEPSAVYTEPYSFGAATQSAYSSHANLPFENAESYTTTTDYDQDSIFAYSVTEPRSSVSEYEYPLEMQPVVEPPTCEPAASFSTNGTSGLLEQHLGRTGGSQKRRRRTSEDATWVDEEDMDEDATYEFQQVTQHSSQQNKRFRLAQEIPVTPVTPSTAFDYHPAPVLARSSSMAVSRTLCYGDLSQAYYPSEPLPRSLSLDGVASLSSASQASPPLKTPVLKTYKLPASPIASPRTSRRPSTVSHTSGYEQHEPMSPESVCSSAHPDHGRFEPYSYASQVERSRILYEDRPYTLRSHRAVVVAERPLSSPVSPNTHQLASPITPSRTRTRPTTQRSLSGFPEPLQGSPILGSPSRRPSYSHYLPSSPLCPTSPASTYTSSRPTTSSGSLVASRSILDAATSMNRLLAQLPPRPSTSGSTASSSSRSSPAPGRSTRGPIESVHPRHSGKPAPEIPELEKTYKCSYTRCAKAFKRQEHLKRHEKTHTNDRPFQCEVVGCEKWFSRSDNLNQHRRTHDKSLTPRK